MAVEAFLRQTQKVLPGFERGNPEIEGHDPSQYSKEEPKCNLLVMVKQIKWLTNVEVNTNVFHFGVTLFTHT